jgi:hypothetical protein
VLKVDIFMMVVGAGFEGWGSLVAAGGGRQVRRQVELFYKAGTHNQSFKRNKKRENPSLKRPSLLNF